jgi:BirA family biotin operon repressor/biotin-[acetyl-CoA-carboxylase] ligase
MDKGHTLIELQTVDSTNQYAEQLLKTQNITEGTIILAHEQISGKGQGENSWTSEPGKNATFSLVLFPTFLSPELQFMLNKSIALGILDFLARLQVIQMVSIKWPNDIYGGNQKMGGILIQNTICGTIYESCIAGIGVNLNQETFIPGLPNAVSLKQLTGIDYPVKEGVVLIAECIDERYLQLRKGYYELLNHDYEEHLYGFNEWRDYAVDKKLVKGKILGVDESGILMMEMENGLARYFQYGEMQFRFP